MSNVNMSDHRVISKERLVIMCLASVRFWHFRELNTDCWTSRYFLCEKIIKYFSDVVEVRILVEK